MSLGFRGQVPTKAGAEQLLLSRANFPLPDEGRFSVGTKQAPADVTSEETELTGRTENKGCAGTAWQSSQH